MESGDQNELLVELSADIAAGWVSVVEEAPILSELHRHFPMGFNRIAWERVAHARRVPAPHPRTVLADYLPAVLRYLEEFASAARILDEGQRVYLVGDSVTDVGFVMSLSTLKRNLGHFLCLPQSTYIVTTDFAWCFNYTFEDAIYFGPSVLDGGDADEGAADELGT